MRRTAYVQESAGGIQAEDGQIISIEDGDGVMVNTGTRFEYDVRDFLKKNGYEIIRAAGSRGPADLVAVSEREILFIQCKKTAVSQSFDEDKKKLEELRVPRNVQKQLWVKKDGTVRVLQLHFGKWELFSHMTLKEFKDGYQS